MLPTIPKSTSSRSFSLFTLYRFNDLKSLPLEGKVDFDLAKDG
jgi:hypothetical protein